MPVSPIASRARKASQTTSASLAKPSSTARSEMKRSMSSRVSMLWPMKTLSALTKSLT